MKIYLARCTASALTSLDGYSKTLGALLANRGHKVQFLDLPPIDAPGRSLTNIASFRLLESASAADAVICLDAVSAVLPHPRKLVLLLDDSHLDTDRVELPDEPMFARHYLANVLKAGLEEAKGIFVLSRYAGKKLRSLAVDRGQLLQTDLIPIQYRYPRNPGPELLVLSPLSDRQRPELLIACLAALPEPFRARWVAPYADPFTLVRLTDLARSAGVEQRLVVDVRPMNEGEKAYVLAHAAALLELAPAMLAAGDSAHQAMRGGVPVIVCSDGGALAEDADQNLRWSAKPDGAALAIAVRSACAAPISPAATPPAFGIGWAPLMKAIRP